MSRFSLGIKTIIKRKDSLTVFLLTSFVILIGYFFIQNWRMAEEVLSFTGLPFMRLIKLFFVTFFDFSHFTNLSVFPLFLGTILFGGLVVSLLYTYIKIREEILFKSGIYGGFGLILAVIGMGCAACGTILLQVIFSLFGFGGLLAIFPYHGLEIGYIGLILLVINSYTLRHKLGGPLTC